jgi:CubicO group peptidase (beta-lactamase class C family)
VGASVKWFSSSIVGFLLFFNTAGAADGADQNDQFSASLQKLAGELTIPGVAYAVVRDGQVVFKGQTGADPTTAPLTVDTPLRFASVTKALTAVALMRAVDRGALTLDDSAGKWLPEFADRPGIQVRHLAAHVSEGTPGEEYVYATHRYSRLGPILTKALKAESFEAVLRAEILAPAQMAWHDSPDLGAHAGFVSSVTDMAQFVQALQRNTLLSQKRFDQMTTPYRSDRGASPAGVGFFSQQIGGERVVWSFGQDDPDHSSALLLMLPRRNLALVLLANTDELSNPFRLLMGDVRYSPFATAFLDAYAPDAAKGIAERERLAQSALIALWNQDRDRATQQFRRFTKSGAPLAGDVVPHFIATILADPESRDFSEALDRSVFEAHSANRWVLLMSGGLNEGLGRRDVASKRYLALLDLPNQDQDGLATLFRAWSYTGLARVFKTSDRQLASQYVKQGLATGVTGGTREDLLALGRDLE